MAITDVAISARLATGRMERVDEELGLEVGVEVELEPLAVAELLGLPDADAAAATAPPVFAAVELPPEAEGIGVVPVPTKVKAWQYW